MEKEWWSEKGDSMTKKNDSIEEKIAEKRDNRMRKVFFFIKDWWQSDIVNFHIGSSIE